MDNRENTAESGLYEVGTRYSACVWQAGGLPVLLPHHAEAVPGYLDHCNAFIFTGGVDPDMAAFPHHAGNHPQSRRMDPTRQTFELALMAGAESAELPVLGICLGMQLLTLRAGGQMDQWMPDSLGQAAEAHFGRQPHSIRVIAPGGPLAEGAAGEGISHHRQRMLTSGSLQPLAMAPDGTLEAVFAPERSFWVGVQWHAERNTDPGQDHVNQALFTSLVQAAARHA